jgi:hypothetical protein
MKKKHLFDSSEVERRERNFPIDSNVSVEKLTIKSVIYSLNGNVISFHPQENI